MMELTDVPETSINPAKAESASQKSPTHPRTKQVPDNMETPCWAAVSRHRASGENSHFCHGLGPPIAYTATSLPPPSPDTRPTCSAQQDHLGPARLAHLRPTPSAPNTEVNPANFTQCTCAPCSRSVPALLTARPLSARRPAGRVAD